MFKTMSLSKELFVFILSCHLINQKQIPALSGQELNFKRRSKFNIFAKNTLSKLKLPDFL